MRGQRSNTPMISGTMTATAQLELGGGTNARLWWRGVDVGLSSRAELKTDIAPAPSALEKIAETGVYTYKWVGDEQHTPEEIAAAPAFTGFVLGEGYDNPPDEIVSNNGECVDLYAAIAMAWRGIQELSAKVKELEGRLAVYENHSPENARQP